MKRFTHKYIAILLTLFSLLMPHSSLAIESQTLQDDARMDSVHISLLTCSPGKEVWSLFGHTAIRYQDLATGEDYVVNYGLFSFNQEYFIPRFVFGKTDYLMGIAPFDVFMAEYTAEGRGVVQQNLNLTDEEKTAIANAIGENYKPENRTYRYNFFYDNCTTRARDIITDAIRGKVVYPTGDRKNDPTYRQMVERHTQVYPWEEEGINILLGANADKETPLWTRQFLPDSLRKDFDDAKIITWNGQERKLVSSKEVLLDATNDGIIEEKSIFSPLNVCVMFFLIVCGITMAEKKYRKSFWLFDAFVLFFTGLAGLALLAMVFSEHPTVSFNPQILIFNPLNLVFLIPLIKSHRKGKYHWSEYIIVMCAVVYLISEIFFIDGAYASFTLASCLLVRLVGGNVNCRRIKNKVTTNN